MVYTVRIPVMTKEALERMLDAPLRGRRDDYELVDAALERARVVGVLDAWSDAHPTSVAFATRKRPGSRHCCASASHAKVFYGDSHDDARSAAAKAIEAGEFK
jgi:hypothetical protein